MKGCTDLNFHQDGRLFFANGGVNFFQSSPAKLGSRIDDGREKLYAVCPDDEDADLVFMIGNQHTMVYSLRNQTVLHKRQHIGTPPCSSVAVIAGKLFAIESLINTITIFSKTGKKELTMRLHGCKFPVAISKYDCNSLISSDLIGVGKFPVCEESRPEWITPIPYAWAVCVDDTGLIYASSAAYQTKGIFVLSSTGEIFISRKRQARAVGSRAS